MSEPRTVEIEVLRYRPERDSEPVWQRYTVPFSSDLSVLQALQHANSEMQRWLMADYGFAERSAQIFMGQALEIEVANIVDPNFTAVAKLPKNLLPPR